MVKARGGALQTNDGGRNLRALFEVSDRLDLTGLEPNALGHLGWYADDKWQVDPEDFMAVNHHGVKHLASIATDTEKWPRIKYD
jgi:hypothetical protein